MSAGTLRDSGKVCARCGCVPLADGFTNGYGTNDAGDVYCFACCAVLDAERMTATGRASLFLVTGDRARGEVINWPGTLRLPVATVTRGRHNMAGVRYDVTFRGPDGAMWHGTQYGDNTHIIHCRRYTRGAP